CLFISLFLALIGIGGITFQKCTATGFYRAEYEGRVVDKGFITHESQLGSSVERYLVLKEENGRQFSVYVSSFLYGRAQIGMWIRRTRTEEQLSSTINSSP